MRLQTDQAYKERILKVLVHIQNHLDEAVSLEDLARVAHFSPFHFHRIFRGMVGESVMEHVRRLRLERSAQRLKHTDTPITRLAFEAGYETHEAYARAFRAMFDMSPSEFRKSHPLTPDPSPQRGRGEWKAPSGVHFAPDGQVNDFEPTKGAEPMEVRIEQMKPVRVAFVRHVGPYAQVGETWSRLMAWAGRAGLFFKGMPVCLGLCHDDPEVTPPDKLRYDACLVVDQSVQPEGEVGVQEIEGGDYAVSRHLGPYDRLGDTYARLCGEWLPASRRELRSAPPFEIYRNSPLNTTPENLITDIYLPLEPC